MFWVLPRLMLQSLLSSSETSTPADSLKRDAIVAIVTGVIVEGVLLTLDCTTYLYPNRFGLWKPESLGRLSQRGKKNKKSVMMALFHN